MNTIGTAILRLKLTWSLSAPARDALLGRSAGRHMRIRPDDVFLVSFPRSGNTWTSFLMGNLVTRADPVTFENLHLFVPDIYSHHESLLGSLPSPRMLKSHEVFTPAYPRVIYVVRDPRDVLVSYYHYQRKFRQIGDDVSMDAFAGRFLDGAVGPFGSWGQHVGCWLGAQEGDPRFLVVRYEALAADPVPQLRRIAGFLGAPADDARLAWAVEHSSRANMQRLEREAAQRMDYLMQSRQDVLFVRSGTVGSWRQELDPIWGRRMAERWPRALDLAGYDLSAIIPTP